MATPRKKPNNTGGKRSMQESTNRNPRPKLRGMPSIPSMESNKRLERPNQNNLEEKQPILKRLPFRKKLLGGKKATTDQEDKEGKLKGPLLFIINENQDCEIRQGIKSGRITVESRGEQTEIMIPSSKLISFPWGNEVIKGWIIDVNEAVALPTSIKHDSLEIKRSIDQMQTNYKNYKAQQTTAWLKGGSQIIWYIGLIILGIFIIAWIAGTDVYTLLGLSKAAQDAATQAATGAV